MQIKIVENYRGGATTPDKYRKAMESIAGQWIKVETDHLFQDQYNVTTPCGAGLRIMQEDVTEIKDDVRYGMGRCHYCGKCQKLQDVCEKCGKSEYMIDLTPRNNIKYDVKPGFIVKEGGSLYYLVGGEDGGMGSAGCPNGHPNKLFSIHEKRGGHISGMHSVSGCTEESSYVPEKVKRTCRNLLEQFNKQYTLGK